MFDFTEVAGTREVASLRGEVMRFLGAARRLVPPAECLAVLTHPGRTGPLQGR